MKNEMGRNKNGLQFQEKYDVEFVAKKDFFNDI